MSKKLITACMALVAFAAVVVPASASAANNPLLTHPTGTSILVGTKITGTNVGNIVLTASDKKTILTECTKSTMTGEITKNAGGNVEGNITATTFAGTGPEKEKEPECTSPAFLGNFSVDTNIGNGTPWCLRSTTTMAEDEFQVRGNECSKESRSITFVLTSTSFGTCKYERTGAISGTFTTDTPGVQDAILHLKDVEFVKEKESPVTCPAVGYLDASYTLETDNPSKAEPIYIS